MTNRYAQLTSVMKAALTPQEFKRWMFTATLGNLNEVLERDKLDAPNILLYSFTWTENYWCDVYERLLKQRDAEVLS